MTRAGRKRPTKRPHAGELGTITRGEQGEVAMVEFSQYTANPLAPTVLVNRILGIYKVSPVLIKVTFGLCATGAGGMRENVERASLVWEAGDIMTANDRFQWALGQWRNGTFREELLGDGGHGRTQ